MQTRQITQYKVYVLNLANMHGGVDKSCAVSGQKSAHKTYQRT
jgi:hypothetical protein